MQLVEPSEFAIELAGLGPEAPPRKWSLEQAQGYTRNLADTHYENFPVVSVFVPKPLRQHFANIYAYCRWSDDLADEVGDQERSLELLDWWQWELDLCYLGQANHPVMVALAETVERFEIPKQPFIDLLTAFRRDQRQTRYDTFDDLVDYCRCSADPVGRLVLYLCERYNGERAALSDAVCTGLQLANFWQDVSRDIDKGRIYLPREDRVRFGVDEADLVARRFTPQFAELLRFEVDRAEALLRRGRPLARQMPGRLKIVIAMFAEGGLAILEKIRRIEYNVLDRRPKLTKWDMACVAARSLG